MASTAQPISNTAARAELQAASEKDHQLMMDQLHITTLRPGRDGNPKGHNPANYDESKANPFPDLPDPLTLKNGTKVTTPKTWWKLRRPQIVEDFDREIYGRVPAHTPKVHWEITSVVHTNNGDIPITTKHLIGHVDSKASTLDPRSSNITVNIDLTLSTPTSARKPVPVMMQLMFNFPPGFFSRLRGTPGSAGVSPANSSINLLPRSDNPGSAGVPPARFSTNSGPTWQQQVLAKGWGYATLVPTSIQADNGAGLTSGIIGLCNKGQPRKPDDWGVLRAWAWGASRALDYFQTDKSVDAKHVGIEGHSRYGKATLVAMAYDPRFAIAYVSSSGEGGAKLHRRDWGEIVENLTGTGEYHWMAGNFIKYGGPLNWNDLPVDSHELIALCAPRPVFISAGSTNGDAWVDAKGSFLAAAAASPVYELLGKKGLGAADFPPIETTLTDGDIAFRQHTSGHTDAPNWPVFLKFAERYIPTAPPTTRK